MSCSFCNSLDHTIRNCDDPMIDVLNQMLESAYVDILNQFPNSVERRFKLILNRLNLRELRAVCATNTNFPISRPKSEIIAVLLFEYNLRYPLRDEVISQDYQDYLQSVILPTEPDPIPDFARDLEEPPEEDSDTNSVTTVDWYLDRNPTTPEQLISHQPPSISLGHRRATNMRDIEYDTVNIGINLTTHFDAVSGNIPFEQHRTKYDINRLLVLNEPEEGTEECAICYENIECMNLVRLTCNHRFCCDCIQSSLKTHKNMYCNPRCALCRTQIKSFIVKNKEIYNSLSENCM